MSRKSISEENVRNLQKSKRSYYVTLPISYIRELKWRAQQKVRVTKHGKQLVIEDWER